MSDPCNHAVSIYDTNIVNLFVLAMLIAGTDDIDDVKVVLW